MMIVLVQETLGNIIGRGKKIMYNMTPFIDLRVGLFHSTGRRSDILISTVASVTAIRQPSAAYNSWLLIQLNYLIIQDIILTKTRPRLSLDSCMEIKTV